MEFHPQNDNSTDESSAFDSQQPVVHHVHPDAIKQSTKDLAIKPAKSRKKLYIFGGLFLLIALGTGAYFQFFKKDTKPAATVQPQQVTEEKKQETPVDPRLEKFIKPTTGEVWLASPKKVADLKYFSGDGIEGTDYYQAGTKGDTTIYIAVTNPANIEAHVHILEKSKDGTVHYIKWPNAYRKADYKVSDYGLNTKKVTIDEETRYDSMSPPTEFTLTSGQKLTLSDKDADGKELTGLSPDFPYTPTQGTKQVELQKFGDSKIIKIEYNNVDTGLTSVSFKLVLPFGGAVNVSYQPLAADLTSYKWDDGKAVTAHPSDKTFDEIQPIARGCSLFGSNNVTRLEGATDDTFVKIGAASDGQSIYAFKDSKNKVVQVAYSEYKDFYSGDGTSKLLSFDNYLKERSILAYKDPNNGWLIYLRSGYAPQGGCGKPVVYLYPTKATDVNVKVGADVRVSDPLYPAKTGWSVRAYPNGNLSYNGKMYDSLLWEGIGSGVYPAIQQGKVVKHSEVLATIKLQLAQQGINPKESTDFIDYWKDYIPDEPYVRLTWFNTSQMNELAPLKITPKPDTVIRVFLDMAGYDHDIKLAPQTLQSIPRKGFTVVEWGGLSPKKLF